MVYKIYLVGIGPGSIEHMTLKAINTLRSVQVVIGRRNCLNLVRELITGKEVISKEMAPINRAKIAVERALKGNNVAIVSVGDPGVYTIASIFFQYLREEKITIPVEVVPGVTAANASAALIGSPLCQDFAVISIGDLSVSPNIIRRRLESAAQGDFVIALYNPITKFGSNRLEEVKDILMCYRKAITPVGIITNATRENETVQVTNLGEVKGRDIDAQTLLIVGNSETFVSDGKMVTPRKYEKGTGY
jgi:precorrin-3B C17-methyltransferase